ncbi:MULTISPECIES: PoNe immunity protein domain-containing protein [Cupriavidus]
MQSLPDVNWSHWLSSEIVATRFEQRREPYLRYATYKKLFDNTLSRIRSVCERMNDPSYAMTPAGKMAATRRRLWDTLDWLSLQYSVGASVELFDEVWPYALLWAEEYGAFDEAFDKSPEAENYMAPHAALRTEDYWTVALRLTCFGLLTGNASEMPRIMAFLDYCNEDMGVRDGLLERLVAPFVPSRGTPPDKATRHLPYRKLFKVFDAPPANRPALMAKYLDEWYHASRREPYIDQHAETDRSDICFYGYWSWEAAAVTWLLDIDDTSYRHMPFYPRDLVDFARQAPSSNRPPLPPPPQYADSPCAQAGFWSTSAKRGSRRYFAQGEIFPAIPSDTTFGLTLWAWDDDQRTTE